MGSIRFTIALAGIMLLSGFALAQKHSTIQPNPGFDQIKGLAGDWEGVADAHGTKIPSVVVVRVVSDGSAVMHELAPGTPHDMITMFHTDGTNLMATHYCAAHNQPRMKLVPSSDPKVLQFEFLDGTNIAPGDVHMKSVKFVFIDADHHTEDWTSDVGGSSDTMHFDFHRKKA